VTLNDYRAYVSHLLDVSSEDGQDVTDEAVAAVLAAHPDCLDCVGRGPRASCTRNNSLLWRTDLEAKISIGRVSGAVRVHRSLPPRQRDGEMVPENQVVAPHRDLTVRDERIRRNLDVSCGVGLEIGPLFSPLVLRGEADIRYADIQSAADLREHYKGDPTVKLDDIVDADYILIQGDGSVLSVGEAAAAGAPFDWILASHVIEHIPDLVAWFKDLSSIMSPGARLSLVIPDRRYCFDALRPPTTVGDILLAHDNQDTRPSARAVFDYFSSVVTVSTADLWEGIVPDSSALIYTVDQAAEMLERSRTGEYMDSHVWLFTPAEFVDQMSVLSQLDLLDFTLLDIIPTAPGELEYYVTLERLPKELAGDERKQKFSANLDDLRAVVSVSANYCSPRLGDDTASPADALSHDASAASTSGGVDAFPVSDRERNLLLAKRSALGVVRKNLRRLQKR
jgi:SAM-dependent methyltransferase